MGCSIGGALGGPGGFFVGGCVGAMASFYCRKPIAKATVNTLKENFFFQYLSESGFRTYLNEWLKSEGQKLNQDRSEMILRSAAAIMDEFREGRLSEEQHHFLCLELKRV